MGLILFYPKYKLIGKQFRVFLKVRKFLRSR